MTAKRVVIRGRVQGVGYRDWLVAEASAMGVAGWVRNGPDGVVEALVQGPTDVVEELLRACRLGPRGALVTTIADVLTDEQAEPGFHRLPSRR